MPDGAGKLLYAGRASYLRYRIGQLLCGLLGFTSDDPTDGETADGHPGRHLLWRRYCVARNVEPLNLHFAECSPCKCMDCALNSLLAMTLFAWACAPQRTCDKRHPTLD